MTSTATHRVGRPLITGTGMFTPLMFVLANYLFHDCAETIRVPAAPLPGKNWIFDLYWQAIIPW